MKWTCKDCGTTLNLKETIVPKSCCVCGGTSMESDAFIQKAEIKQQNEAALVAVTDKLNALYAEAEPLLAEYKQIMNYFKNLYLKKQITADEYSEKAALFKYRKTGGRPIGSKMTDDMADAIADAMVADDDTVTVTATDADVAA